jgi:hypothetical protein
LFEAGRGKPTPKILLVRDRRALEMPERLTSSNAPAETIPHVGYRALKGLRVPPEEQALRPRHPNGQRIEIHPERVPPGQCGLDEGGAAAAHRIRNQAVCRNESDVDE